MSYIYIYVWICCSCSTQRLKHVSVALHPCSSWLLDVIIWDNLFQSCDSIFKETLYESSCFPKSVWENAVFSHFIFITDSREDASKLHSVSFFFSGGGDVRLFLKISNHKSAWWACCPRERLMQDYDSQLEEQLSEKTEMLEAKWLRS